MSSDHHALRLAATGGAALCTLIGIEGSFSRRIGAQIAVSMNGQVAGEMADNCLTEELASQSLLAMASGKKAVLRYGAGSPFVDFRLPCGSGLDVLIDPKPDLAALQACVADLEARRPTSLSLPIIPQGGLLQERNYIPPLRLLVFGTGRECAALEALCKAQEIEFLVREPGNGLVLRHSPLDVRVDAWSAILLLFHDHEWEHTLLEWALGTDAFYIGAQGGAPARENRIQTLCSAGYDDTAIARLKSPVGLIPHARDPQVLALSILAEVVGAYEALQPHR